VWRAWKRRCSNQMASPPLIVWETTPADFMIIFVQLFLSLLASLGCTTLCRSNCRLLLILAENIRNQQHSYFSFRVILGFRSRGGFHLWPNYDLRHGISVKSPWKFVVAKGTKLVRFQALAVCGVLWGLAQRQKESVLEFMDTESHTPQNSHRKLYFRRNLL